MASVPGVASHRWKQEYARWKMNGTREHGLRILGSRRLWIAVTILLFLVGLALTEAPLITRLAQGTPLSPVPRNGSRILNFALPTAAGESIATDQFAGKVLIINFWATWCQPCREEMPTLQSVYDKYRERGLALLGVNYGEGSDAVVGYVREIGVSFPIVLDRDMTVGQLYRVQGLPTTIFVDRQGIVRDMVLGGPMSASYIESKIRPLLDEK